jgi:hypothetical protein
VVCPSGKSPDRFWLDHPAERLDAAGKSIARKVEFGERSQTDLPIEPGEVKISLPFFRNM